MYDRLLVLEDVLILPLGVLPDATMLLQDLQTVNRHERQQMKQPLSGLAMARAIAMKCQSHAFGGGLRVFGSTILLTSVEEGRIIVHRQTDPSGSIQSLEFEKPIVIGGGAKQTSWQRKLDKLMVSLAHHSKELTPTRQAMIARLVEFARSKLLSAESETTLEVAIVSSTEGVFKPSPRQLDAMILKPTAQ